MQKVTETGRGGGRASRAMLAVCAALALLLAGIIGAGSVSTVFAAGPVTVGGKAVVTNTDGDPIRIRQDAGTEYAKIGAAYEGQSVNVLAGPRTDTQGRPWFKIEAPGGTGWMMAEFLEGTGPASEPKLTGSARVANTDGDPLRMREAPSTSGKVLTMLSPGTTVSILGGPVADEAGIVWYTVSAKGYNGWVMAQYLAQAPAAVETQAPKKEPAPQPQATVVAQNSGVSTTEQYRIWMEEARVMYPYKQTLDKMWSVMMCESGGNARASGGGGRWLGLFQYAPGTWGGSWNPYRGNSIWDAKSQIFATARAWSIGMQSHWSCYYITPGR